MSGDFTADAYEQLRNAYANQLATQPEHELAGKEIMGQKMTVETLPVDSPWKDKIQSWTYPDGKSAYLDGKQSPEEILEVMRDSVRQHVAEKEEAEIEAQGPDIDAMSDEEFDKFIDQILEEPEEESEEEEIEEESEEESEEPTAEVEAPVEEDEDPELEPEVEAEVQAELQVEDEIEEEVLPDPTDIAEKIAELKAEISNFQFVNEDADEVHSDEEEA